MEKETIIKRNKKKRKQNEDQKDTTKNENKEKNRGKIMQRKMMEHVEDEKLEHDNEDDLENDSNKEQNEESDSDMEENKEETINEEFTHPKFKKKKLSKDEKKSFKNKQRVLIFSTRGITHRYRHLMNDLRILLPHSKKRIKIRFKRSTLCDK